MADEGESTVVGRSIEYSANSITWNGSKAQRATAKMLDVTNKQYRDSYRVDLNSLGMKSEKATIIEIAHPDANVIDCSTQIPGDTVMFKDRNTIIIWVDNNYFEAVRQPNT
jgi:exosome complex RNA-binding protein Rrp42 (RNase PH superfamily)